MTPLAAHMLAAHRQLIGERGEPITLRRGTGSSMQSISALAHVAGYAPDELVGDIHQGDRKIIVMAADVTFSPPLSDDDRIILRGQPLRILSIDDSTRRVAGTLIAYEITARGGT